MFWLPLVLKANSCQQYVQGCTTAWLRVTTTLRICRHGASERQCGPKPRVSYARGKTGVSACHKNLARVF